MRRVSSRPARRANTARCGQRHLRRRRPPAHDRLPRLRQNHSPAPPSSAVVLEALAPFLQSAAPRCCRSSESCQYSLTRDLLLLLLNASAQTRVAGVPGLEPGPSVLETDMLTVDTIPLFRLPIADCGMRIGVTVNGFQSAFRNPHSAITWSPCGSYAC